MIQPPNECLSTAANFFPLISLIRLIFLLSDLVMMTPPNSLNFSCVELSLFKSVAIREAPY